MNIFQNIDTAIGKLEIIYLFPIKYGFKLLISLCWTFDGCGRLCVRSEQTKTGEGTGTATDLRTGIYKGRRSDAATVKS